MTQPGFNFDPQALIIAPSVYPQARETSALAAVANLERRATQNTRVLVVIRAAGEAGLSDPEIQRLTGFERSTICLRRHDLRSLLEPAARRYKHFGRWCQCWKVKA